MGSVCNDWRLNRNHYMSQTFVSNRQPTYVLRSLPHRKIALSNHYLSNGKSSRTPILLRKVSLHTGITHGIFKHSPTCSIRPGDKQKVNKTGLRGENIRVEAFKSIDNLIAFLGITRASPFLFQISFLSTEISITLRLRYIIFEK